MRVDKTRIGIVRPFKRHAEERQRAALQAAGASMIYVIGKDGVMGWQDIANQRRRGDVAMIEYLSLLPSRKSVAQPFPAMDMRDALEAFERRGCVIVETSTGRRTDNPEQRKTMIADAARSLGYGRALPSDVARENGAKAGRRRFDWSPWRDKIEACWDATSRYKTRAAALEAMRKRGVPKNINDTTIHRIMEDWRGKGRAGRFKSEPED